MLVFGAFVFSFVGVALGAGWAVVWQKKEEPPVSQAQVGFSPHLLSKMPLPLQCLVLYLEIWDNDHN